MARHGDIGPYAVGNVRICLNEENKRDAHRLRRGKPMSANRLAALARAREAKFARHAIDAPLFELPDVSCQSQTAHQQEPPSACE
jgi:hypothetical protein